MTKKLTRASLLTALAAGILALSGWVPRGGLALAALAALAGAAVLIECGAGWAVGHFIAAAILGLLLCPDKSAALWFLFVFGPWPVLKHFIERLKRPALRWALKAVTLCALPAVLYFAFSAAFLGQLPKLPWYVLLPCACAALIVYDIAFSRLIGLYLRTVHRASR